MHSRYSVRCWRLLKNEKITSGSVSIAPAALIPHFSLTSHSSAPSTWLPPMAGSANFAILNIFLESGQRHVK